MPRSDKPSPAPLAEWRLRVVPRSWQQAALSGWQQERRGVVSVVTGAGKTVLAEMCMLSFLHEYPDAVFVIVVPSIALVDQWYVSLREDLGASEDEIAVVSGGRASQPSRRVNLLVINSARTWMRRSSNHSPTFLIVDECHRAGSPSNRLALSGRFQATLGLSATPVRDYDNWFQQFVSPVLGPIVFEYDYIAARRDDVICSFELINVRFALLPHEEDAYRRLSSRIARLRRTSVPPDDERIKRLLIRRAAVSAQSPARVPVVARLVEKHRGLRTLIFHESIAGAQTISKVLQARGFQSTEYHSGLSAPLRRDNLRMFRRGLFDCIVTCRALDEGTNVPEAAVAIVGSSTRSTRQRIQRLGRVLRPAPGKSSATVYTVYATESEELSLRREEQRLGEVTAVKWLASTRSRHG